MERPYTFINAAMTADGKIDTCERRGAAISTRRDKERVDELRASADAILVGGRTLLEEQPKLTVKSEALRTGRILRGLSPNPIKLGVVTAADISPDSEFLRAGDSRVVIFTTSQTSISQLERLRALGVEVFVDETPRVDLHQMMINLKNMGINRLMVEGGGTVNFELIRLGLVDELMLFVAPMVFGGAGSPTPADGVGFPFDEAKKLKLAGFESWEDGGVLLRYRFE